MEVEFTDSAWEEFSDWMEADANIGRKIRELIADIRRTPFKGLGKPEPLKHELKGFWSRRITSEHRLLYKVYGRKGVDQKCRIFRCRFHYD